MHPFWLQAEAGGVYNAWFNCKVTAVTQPDNFCLQPKRMYDPLLIKATLFINFCATVIVGTWVVRLKGYNRGLSSTCPKSFSRSIFLRTEAHWPALASQSEALKLKLPFLPQDNIFYKTLHAHMNIKKKFSILARGRTSFHLSTLEAT